MRKLAVLIGFCLACLGPPARADDWVRPEPTSFHARGFSYVAEIFPPHSRQNAGDKPLCYFYELGYPGIEWRVDAHLRWKAPLVNDPMPYQALVSQRGYLVTLNDHGRVGYQNAVTIYDRGGKLVKSFALEDLLPANEISLNENESKVPISSSSRWWNRGAKYFFLDEPARLYVIVSWGSVLEFFLDSGKTSYGAIARYRDVAELLGKPFADEETEAWRTSLRFSSITDVLAAKENGR